jgi:hypothetical protein
MPAIELNTLRGWVVYGTADPFLGPEIQKEIQSAPYWPSFEKLAFEGGHDLDAETLAQLQQKMLA